MRWHIGNAAPIAFELHKTNEALFGMVPPPVNQNQIENILLPGAVFVLYRYTGTGTPANAQMPAAGWTRMLGQHTSTGDPDFPIGFRLGFNGDQSYSYYQLVELFAPVGYTVPFGQWRIRMDVIDLVTHDITITVQTLGHSVPEFVRLSEEQGYVFAVGNRRMFQLPLTGGSGRGMVLYTGLAAMFVGCIAAGYMVLVKAEKRKESYAYRCWCSLLTSLQAKPGFRSRS